MTLCVRATSLRRWSKATPGEVLLSWFGARSLASSVVDLLGDLPARYRGADATAAVLRSFEQWKG